MEGGGREVEGGGREVEGGGREEERWREGKRFRENIMA